MRGFRELDRILRGGAAPAPGAALAVPLGPLIAVDLLLAALYGVCMGSFGVFGRPEPDFRLILADAFKVPLLFLLTLVVTFPSLYVFNALVVSRLGAPDLARLLAAALGVHVAVLAAFGPIVAFFSVTTATYAFILLLNVAVFALAAGFAMTFLLRMLDKLTLPLPPMPTSVTPPPSGETAAPEGEIARPPVEAELEPLPETPEREETTAEVPERERPGRRESAPRRERRDHPDRFEGPPRRPRAEVVREGPVPDPKVRAVFWGWLVVFALVGSQMSWVLRPFIGMPYRDFTWFRPREGSFFEGVWKALLNLFGG
jgi:hypothetical protein